MSAVIATLQLFQETLLEYSAPKAVNIGLDPATAAVPGLNARAAREPRATMTA